MTTIESPATEAQIGYARKLQAHFVEHWQDEYLTTTTHLLKVRMRAGEHHVAEFSEAQAADWAEISEAIGQTIASKADEFLATLTIKAWRKAHEDQEIGAHRQAILDAICPQMARDEVAALLVDPATLTKAQCSALIDTLTNPRGAALEH